VRLIYANPREEAALLATGRASPVRALRGWRPTPEWSRSNSTRMYLISPRPLSRRGGGEGALGGAHQGRIDGIHKPRRSEFDRLKAPAQAATIGKLKERLVHLAALDALGRTEAWRRGCRRARSRTLPGEARMTDAADMRKVTGDDKRLTLLISLVQECRTAARDNVVTMFCKRIAALHRKGRKLLDELHEQHRAESERAGRMCSRLWTTRAGSTIWPPRTRQCRPTTATTTCRYWSGSTARSGRCCSSWSRRSRWSPPAPTGVCWTRWSSSGPTGSGAATGY
jgi:hypothetical protein